MYICLHLSEDSVHILKEKVGEEFQLISYFVGRNFGHLSPCIAIIQSLQKHSGEKVHLYAYESAHEWLRSNLRGRSAEIKPFSRRYVKRKKYKLLERSDLIFHDWREEVAFIKQVREKHAPIMGGMFHSDLQIGKEDNKETIKFKRQIQDMANQTTDIFFHMNLLQPKMIPKLATKYVPIPIVARIPEMTAAQVKEKLGIPEKEPYVLVQMGGGTGPYKYKYMEKWYHILNQLKTDYHIVVCNQLSGVDFPFGKHIRMAPLFSNGVDLVDAAEMVITKPGRGIIYDCISTRTPVLLLPADTKERAVQNMMVKELLGDSLWEADNGMDHKNLKARLREIAKNKEAFMRGVAKIPTNGAEIVAQCLTLLSGAPLDQLEEHYQKILAVTPFRIE